jgi:hypothetical protein
MASSHERAKRTKKLPQWQRQQQSQQPSLPRQLWLRRLRPAHLASVLIEAC